MPERVNIDIESVAALRQLTTVLDKLHPLLLPDFSIKAKMPGGHCTRVEYEVTMHPGLLTSLAGSSAPPVAVYIDCRGDQGELVRTNIHYFASGTESTQKGIFQWEVPDYADFQPDWDGCATVTVNPPGTNHVAERSDSNNSVKVCGTCIG